MNLGQHLDAETLRFFFFKIDIFTVVAIGIITYMAEVYTLVASQMPTTLPTNPSGYPDTKGDLSDIDGTSSARNILQVELTAQQIILPISK